MENKPKTIEFEGRVFGLGSLGPDIPDVRDARIPRSFLRRTLGEGISPIGYVPSTPLHDQGSQGSCVGQSVTKVLEIKATQEKAKLRDKPFGDVMPVQLSRSFAYALGRTAINTLHVDSGCHARDVIKGIAKWGIPSEALVPYDETALLTAISQAAALNAQNHKITQYYSVRTVDEVRAALATGHPVSFAQPVYGNYPESTGKQGFFPPPEGAQYGAHQTTFVGWDDSFKVPGWLGKGALLVENSWGADHGIDNPFTGVKGGHYWMPYQAAMSPDLCYDLWTVHSIPLL